MTRITTFFATAALALAFGAAAAMAQAPSTAPATAAKTAPVKGAFKLKQPTTEIGKQCTAEADAKGVHGKERRKMRADCKKRLTASKKQ